MGYSEAMRIPSGLFALGAWPAAPSVIISVNSPRRRWVGATVTLVSAATSTSVGPGTVKAVAKERSVPTTPLAVEGAPRAVAGRRRPGSTRRSPRATVNRNPTPMHCAHASISDASIGPHPRGPWQNTSDEAAVLRAPPSVDDAGAQARPTGARVSPGPIVSCCWRSTPGGRPGAAPTATCPPPCRRARAARGDSDAPAPRRCGRRAGPGT